MLSSFPFRSIPGVLVQELRVTNPTGSSVMFSVERVGVDRWDGAKTQTKTIEHGDGSHAYSVVTGSVRVPPPPEGAGTGKEQDTFKMVAVVARKLKQTMDVEARTTKTMNVVTAVAYSSEPLPQARLRKEEAALRESLAAEAVASLQEALSVTSNSLRQSHQEVWDALWTTGFGISR